MHCMVHQLDRERLVERFCRNRERSAQLFSLIDENAYEERPIPLRHPFIFYLGHLPAFNFLVLNERALREAPLDPDLESLFERGIDPGSLQESQRHARTHWPSRDAVERFGRDCDARVERALRHARLVDPSVPRLVRGQAVYTALEHEQMHHETLVYIIHQLDCSCKVRIEQLHRDGEPPPNVMCEVAAGTAVLGADPNDIPFGWDNEFGRCEVPVGAFSIQRYPVTNADWLVFMNDGGAMPPFWIECDGEFFLRAAFEELPLPRSWPVYVSHDLAAGYAAWAGMRLPTEAEFVRAAYGSPSGMDRPYPWGGAVPQPAYGNFDFQRFDPQSVDAHPGGASAWGVEDLIGNGWEWTSSAFAPFPGFEPMASYPQYSVDFFDAKHYVLKGASPVTARELIRPSFRNWFYGDYPYAYAKFRCAA
jgi:iron(II)-dependent oxidoreductase